MNNNKLKLAVAGAVLAFGSHAANAGIIIPAGDWTVDLSGNMNTFYSNTDFTGSFSQNEITGGSVSANQLTQSFALTIASFGLNSSATGVQSVVAATTKSLTARASGSPLSKNANQISTGLLPSAIGIGAKTRQNDLDVAIQTTFFVGANSSSAGSGAYGASGAGGNSLNIRQAFLSFGDKSWGTIKMGRDLGTFGSDAILSDMTLLGVGTGAGGAGNSTLGRIGSGYLYADWVGQIQYQSPNFSGFQLQGALREPWANASNSQLGYEGKATFDFNANDVSGRIWVGGIQQEISTAGSAAVAASSTTSTTFGAAASSSYVTVTTVKDAQAAVASVKKDARAVDVGAKISFAGLGLVGYYYDGQNIGSGGIAGNTPLSGLFLGDSGSADRDVKGGYVQATYKLPVGTTVGASWGISKVKQTAADRTAYTAALTGDYENESWIVGAYHPITKHLNLVGEYTNTEYQNVSNFKGYDGKAKTFSLGAILFF